MKYGKGWVRGRIRRTVYNMMTLSFLTWCALLACYFVNHQPIDWQFLTFTAAVIGIKKFLNLRQPAVEGGTSSKSDVIPSLSRNGEERK